MDRSEDEKPKILKGSVLSPSRREAARREQAKRDINYLFHFLAADRRSAASWGRTGFDGDAEAGVAGGCAQHP